MINSTRKPRQTAEQWQSIIDQQSASGLSTSRFCTEYDITYQSFMRWRKKLQSNLDEHAPVESPPGFVELTAPDKVQPVADYATTWHIELDLAPGVQLRIAR